jgi:hypothetical protein
MSNNDIILVISDIQQHVSPEYIATVFAKHQIALVSSISFTPYFIERTIYFRAYIKIWRWCESEAAYNFIKRIEKKTEARVVHHDDEYWVIDIHRSGMAEEFPPNPKDCLIKTFSLPFYDRCLDIDLAEQRLANAHRDLIFATEFGDDYDAQVDAEFAYEDALDVLRELHCKTNCNVTTRSHKIFA